MLGLEESKVELGRVWNSPGFTRTTCRSFLSHACLQYGLMMRRKEDARLSKLFPLAASLEMADAIRCSNH